MPRLDENMLSAIKTGIQPKMRISLARAISILASLGLSDLPGFGVRSDALPDHWQLRQLVFDVPLWMNLSPS